ncbi:hypothetical protein [Flavobacterium difficile]|uniref:Uncharacterized protein n=1 Tax=Flavobacterium difficile TaxID=2709659 RepID=A0ABX0I3J8_9FLAO|nr:hypothetical protein [Flavobacterium difficile]NHM01764.1 hypothetical protein [Flavobacterium difficile]
MKYNPCVAILYTKTLVAGAVGNSVASNDVVKDTLGISKTLLFDSICNCTPFSKVGVPIST